MTKLCIVLTTDYSKDSGSEVPEWTAETSQDLATVRELFASDHRMIEIKIDATVDKRTYLIEQEIDSQLTPQLADISNNSECHIIINSHGAVGAKDIQDTAVLSVIKRLSDREIRINQMTALICHAMSQPRSKREDTAMGILIKKINKRAFSLDQSFPIYGPADAYDPVRDKQMVVAMLEGNIKDFSKIRYQDITISRSCNIDEAKIEAAINFLQLIQIKGSHSEYLSSLEGKSERNKFNAQYSSITSQISNIFSYLYSELEENIAHFHTIEDNPAFSLYQALSDFAQTNALTLRAETLNDIYSQWLKEYKPYHAERLNVLRQIIGQELLTSTKIVSSSSESRTSPISITHSFSPISEDIATPENRFFQPVDLSKQFEQAATDGLQKETKLDDAHGRKR